MSVWNRRKEEEFTTRPVAGPPAPSELAKEGIPMSTLPGRSSEPHYDTARTAVLGKSVIVKGQIFSREDLTIDGEVEGTVELQEHRLTIGPNGKVRASVKARELVVLGTIHGNVETTDKIDIRKEAKLVGDIKTARIVIEDGAYFKGNIDIVRAEARARPRRSPSLRRLPRAPRRAPSTSGSSSDSPAMAAGARRGKMVMAAVRVGDPQQSRTRSILLHAGGALRHGDSGSGRRQPEHGQLHHQLRAPAYSDDFLRQLDQCFGQGDFYENQIQPPRRRDVSPRRARFSR